jgi:hypothetical protein
MEVQRSQGFEVIHALRRVLAKFGRQVALHHCGSSQVDNIGRAFAVRVGWQVEAHPADKAAGMIPWRTVAHESRSEVIHPAQMRAERDMEIIRTSRLIVQWNPTGELLQGWSAR